MKKILKTSCWIYFLFQTTSIDMYSRQLQWKNLGYPTPYTALYQGSTIDSAGNIYVAMEYGGIFKGFGYDSFVQHWLNPWTHCYFSTDYIFQLFSDPGGFTYAEVEGVGIIRTSDEGKTWENKSNGLPAFPSVNAFGLLNSNTVLALTYPSHLYGSTNHGDTWNLLPGIESLTEAAVAIHQAPSGDVLLGTVDNGMFRSKDGCKTWESVPFFSPSLKISSIASLPNGALIVSCKFSGVYLSLDNGKTWQDILHSRFNYFISVATYSSNTIICADAVGDVYITKDYGQSWDSLGIFNEAIRSIACSPKGDLYVFTAGDFPFVYKLNNSSHWSLRIPNYSVISMASKDSILVVGGESGISILQVSNIGYENNGPLAAAHDILFSKDQSFYVGYKYMSVYRYFKNETYYLYSPVPTPASDGNCCFSLAENRNGLLFAGTGKDYFCDTVGTVFSTSNQGATWQKLGNNLPPGSIQKLLVTKTNTLLASVAYKGLFRIEEQSISWNSVTGFQPAGTGLAESFAQDSSGLLFCGTDHNGIYLSDDDGKSWSQVQGSRSLDRVTDLLAIPNGTILATTKSGVFLSSDKGQTWQGQNLGLTSPTAWAAAIDCLGYLYIGTYGAGIFKSSSALTSIKTDKSLVSLRYQLYQNYPNPFNPSTTISFLLTNDAQVSLKIFDILGRLVHEFASLKLSAGKHEYQWNASQFPSGIYFYQLKVGEYSETKKLVLLK